MTSLSRAAFVAAGETHAQTKRSDLRRQLRKAERRNLLGAYGLVLPLFAFVLFGFLMPLGIVLWNSVYDPQIGDGMPRTIAALKGWSPHQSAHPGEAAFAALAQDMKAAEENQSASALASRLNFEAGGLRTLFMRTTREIVDIEAGPWTARFLAIDSRWAQLQTWAAIQQAGHRYTSGYYLKALDLRQDTFGEVVRASEDSRIHLDAFGRTLAVSATVALLCLLLGYPVAHLLSRLKPRHGNLLMICVLLPFWTSLLVRTTAWIVLLQKDGVANSLLMTIGLVDRPLDLMTTVSGLSWP